MRVCGDCGHGALSQSGVFCLEYRETIFDELVAEECQAFDELPGLGTPVNVRSGKGLLVLDQLPELLEDFFVHQHYTLFGQTFYLNDPERRQAAVDWLIGLLTEVVAFGAER